MTIPTTRTMAVNLCSIVSNTPVNDEYWLMVVDAPAIALTAQPGQFFHLKCDAAHGLAPFLRRPMSIYDIDRDTGRLSFLYKIEGRGTAALSARLPGETLDALGPLGRGFTLPENARHLLVLGRGVGLATLAPLADLAKSHGVRVTAVLSARTPDVVMSVELLERHGARVVAVTDSEGSSDVATLTTRLNQMHGQDPFDMIATCGSNRLFHLSRDLCRSWGITGQVALEARMGCGTGMCLACVVRTRNADGAEDYKTVCGDGPVFGLEEALSW